MLHRLRLPDKGPGPGIITHCHSERQYLSFRAAVPVIPSGCEESGGEGWDNGPRTSQIRILLKAKLLQNIIVRGPCFFGGTTNKVILHCAVSQ